jgi:hypothetical protein
VLDLTAERRAEDALLTAADPTAPAPPVNRRTIDVAPDAPAFRPSLMAERGTDHAGFDCFVVPTRLLEHFTPSRCCCGAGNVMRSLLFNLVGSAHRMLMLTTPQMTFHLGDDRLWTNPAFADYEPFNVAEALSVIATLICDAKKAERLCPFVEAHEADIFKNALPRMSHS